MNYTFKERRITREEFYAHELRPRLAHGREVFAALKDERLRFKLESLVMIPLSKDFAGHLDDDDLTHDWLREALNSCSAIVRGEAELDSTLARVASLLAANLPEAESDDDLTMVEIRDA